MHQQQPYLRSDVPSCSGRLSKLWWNLVPSAREFLTSHCVYTYFTLCSDCGYGYIPSEQHVCYTLCRGCSYVVAVDTTPGDIYAFLWPCAILYHSVIAIYRKLHSPHICFAWRCCHLLQYNLCWEYIACCCICFAIIEFSRSAIYCRMFALSTTMPSVLHILHWPIIGLRFFFVLIRIRILAIIALIPVDITGFQVKPLEFSCVLWWLGGGRDSIVVIAFVTCTFAIPADTCHPEMQFIIGAIVSYRDVWVSASDLRFLKHQFGGQIVKKNGIVNIRCFHADSPSRCCVLRVFNSTLDCSKSVFRHPLIHFQLTAMAPNGSRKGNRKINARAKMRRSIINLHLLLVRDCIKWFISEHIPGLIWIYNVHGCRDEMAWDLLYDSSCLDPLTTCQMSRLQLMWPQHMSRCSPFQRGGRSCVHIWGKYFTKPATKSRFAGETTPVPLGIKSIAPTHKEPAQRIKKNPASISFLLVW